MSDWEEPVDWSRQLANCKLEMFFKDKNSPPQIKPGGLPFEFSFNRTEGMLASSAQLLQKAETAKGNWAWDGFCSWLSLPLFQPSFSGDQKRLSDYPGPHSESQLVPLKSGTALSRQKWKQNSSGSFPAKSSQLHMESSQIKYNLWPHFRAFLHCWGRRGLG